MAKRVLSIEIGDWWTKVVLAEPYKKSPTVHNIFYFRTPDNTVGDGTVRDRDRFLTALKAELKQRDIRERDVIFLINSTKVINREITIPFVKDKLLPGIVEAQAKEHFPMDITGYTITYQKLGDYVDDDKKKQLKLGLIAVPDNLLSNYLALAKAGSYSVESFEYIGNSVVSFARTHYNVNNVVVQLEENATIVSIVVNKKLAFQRVVPNGYGNVLSTVLEHPVLNVESAPEAYHFLTTHNLLYKRPRVGDLSTEDEQRRQKALENAYADVREALSYQIRVTLAALEYYKNQSKKDFFGVMRLVGDGARIAGIQKFFTDEIPLELAQDSPLSHVNLSKNVSRQEMSEVDFTSAIGAVIAPLNIKPKETLAKEAKKNTMVVAYLGFTATLAISAALGIVGAMRYIKAAGEHDRLTIKIQELSYIQRIYDEHEEVSNQAEEFLAFDLMTWTDNEMALLLIESLEKQLPDTIVVQSLNLNGSAITMSMTSPNKLTTAQMLMNFKEIPYLEQVSIPSMVSTEDELGNTEWTYSVTAVYANPLAVALDELISQLENPTTEGVDSSEQEQDSTEEGDSSEQDDDSSAESEE